MMKKLNIIKFIIAIFVSLNSYNFAQAEQPTLATNYISDLAYNISNLLNNKNLNDNTKDQQLKEIFLTNVDTKWIGRFVMGKHWRTISINQQNEYQKEMSKFLVSNYLPYFKNYNTKNIKVLSSNEISNNEYLVNTEILIDESNNPIRIDYRIIRNPETKNFIIFDVVIEGISLIATQRSEIDSVMNNGGFNQTMNLIKQKTKNALTTNKK